MTNCFPPYPASTPEIAVYDCEVHLRFRLIEDAQALAQMDRRQLLEALLDAYSYGEDDYLELTQSEVNVQPVAEVAASPAMRRRMLRLRNSSDVA